MKNMCYDSRARARTVCSLLLIDENMMDEVMKKVVISDIVKLREVLAFSRLKKRNLKVFFELN